MSCWRWVRSFSFAGASLTGAAASLALEPESARVTHYTLRSSGIDLESNYNPKLNIPTNNAVTLHQHHEWRSSEETDALTVTLRYRLIYDHENPHIMRQLQTEYLERLIAYGSGYIANVRVSVGLQEVTWGESTVMPILDVVNMRSITHPRGFYDPAAKVPAAMLRAEWQGEIFNAEVIAVPRPERLHQPEEVGDFDVAPMHEQGIPPPEYGARLGIYWLGIDSKAYYYRHTARIPSYRFKPFGGDGDLIQDVDAEDTFGLSSSYAFETVTMRADLAETHHIPSIGVGREIEHTSLRQGIVGLSWATASQHTLGIEWHTDSWAEQPVSYTDGAFITTDRQRQTLSWIAYTANLRMFDGKVEGVGLYYRGVEKADELIRYGANYAASDNLSFGFELVRTYAESRSPLLLLNKRESVSLRLSWTQ